MLLEAEVPCPYCGQTCTLELDANVPSQQFVTDCEVCCRPMTVHAQCEGGELVAIATTGD